MGTDPEDPEFSPRDGRMRRKNMLGPDENLLTLDDHLLGVDLNRNNPPYWASNPERSSDVPEVVSVSQTPARCERYPVWTWVRNRSTACTTWRVRSEWKTSKACWAPGISA